MKNPNEMHDYDKPLTWHTIAYIVGFVLIVIALSILLNPA